MQFCVCIVGTKWYYHQKRLFYMGSQDISSCFYYIMYDDLECFCWFPCYGKLFILYNMYEVVLAKTYFVNYEPIDRWDDLNEKYFLAEGLC